MNINPNHKLKFNNSNRKYLSEWIHCKIPRLLPVQLIEIPPHTRTVKIEYIGHEYIQLPYIQFYFTELTYKRSIFTFASSSQKSILNHAKEIRGRRGLSIRPNCAPLGNCDLAGTNTICWGDCQEKTIPKLINYFWNSEFYDPPEGIKKTIFKVLL